MALSLLGHEGWVGGQAAAGAESGAGRGRGKMLPETTGRGPTIHGKVQTASLSEELTASILPAQLGLLGWGQGLGVHGHSCPSGSIPVPA